MQLPVGCILNLRSGCRSTSQEVSFDSPRYELYSGTNNSVLNFCLDLLNKKRRKYNLILDLSLCELLKAIISTIAISKCLDLLAFP